MGGILLGLYWDSGEENGNSNPKMRGSLQAPAGAIVINDDEDVNEEVSDLRATPFEMVFGYNYSSFHFLFHYPYITPIYYSSFHLLFHYTAIPGCQGG